MSARVSGFTSGFSFSLLPSSNRLTFKLAGFLVLTLLLAAWPAAAQASGAAAQETAAAKQAFQGIPIRFEPNRGQREKDVRFLTHLADGDLALTGDGFRLTYAQGGKDERLSAKFVGMNGGSEAAGEDAGKGVANYYMGRDAAKWIRNLPLFAKVRYGNAYPATDLVYRATEGKLEYDLELKPGADAGRIALAFSGADKIQLDAGGNLVVGVGKRTLRFLAPDSYQMENGKRVAVRSKYEMLAGNRVGFSIGDYNHAETLVIDPVVAYATFLDLSAHGTTISPLGMTLDPAGNVYVALTVPYASTAESLLIKVGSSGDTVYQNTIQALPNTLVSDASGNLYMVGWAGASFPTTTNLGSCAAGGSDCYSSIAAKFDPTGNIIYATALGPGEYDSALPTSIAVNAGGDLFMAGSGIIQPVNAYQPAPGGTGATAAFFAELNPTGTAYVFASYLGTQTTGSAIALDSSGNVYVAGLVPSVNGGIPLLGDFEAGSEFGGAFLSKFTPDGQTLLFSTMLPIGSFTGMAVGSDNTVYLVGTVGAAFPWTPGSYRYPLSGSYSSGGQMFAMAINPSLTGLTYSEFLGMGYPNAMTLDANGDLFVAGSTIGDVPPTADAVVAESMPPASQAGFYLKLDPKGKLLTSSGFGGSLTYQVPHYIAADTQGDIYLEGSVGGSCLNPDPITVGTNASLLQSELYYCGGNEFFGDVAGGFLAEIQPANEPQISLSPIAPFLELRNVGTADLQINSITSSSGPVSVSGTCGSTVPAASACWLALSGGNGSSPEEVQSLTINSNAQPNVQTFDLTGGPNWIGPNPGYMILFDTSKLIFGAQETGVASAPQPFTITNLGFTPVAISSITGNSGFSETNNCPASLAGNTSCTVQAEWIPGANPLPEITVNYGPPAEGGTATIGPLGPMINNPTALLVNPQEIEGPQTLGFGSQTVGNGSLYRTIPITNVGNTTMGAPQVTLSGDSTFSMVWNTCTADLAPQQSCAVAILFQPFAALTSQGLVTVNGGGASSEVALAGTGIAGPPVTTIGISPTSTTAGSGEFTLTVTGTGFTSGSKVVWDSTVLATTFVSATELTADVPANLVSSETTVQVLVGTPGVGVSSTSTFTINALAPTITSISPANVAAGSQSFWLTVYGTNFTGESAVKWNGIWQELQDYISPTELQVFILSNLVATQGSGQVTVVTPGPGGGTSGAETLTINAPPGAPTVSGISPTSATAGAGSFLLTVTGTNFTSKSMVMWGSTSLGTGFVSDTELQVTVPATQLEAGGNISVWVLTPPPGGGSSSLNTFTVSVLAPTISGISPTTVTAGAGSFPLTVTGTNFTSQSTVMWGSTALATTYVSGTTLTAQVTAALVAAEGTDSVTVVTPAPGGGTSAASTFTVNAQGPTISGISPTTTTAGSAAFPLTVTGTNFTSQSTVMWGTTALTTTYVSATTLTAQVTAPLVATEGTVSVTVVTPAPGGGTSGGSTFTVNALAPTLGSLSPTSTSAGSATFPLTVTGTNFTSTSTVMWGTTALATTFVSGTTLTAQVTAALVAAEGTDSVTVVTPAPGGGTSSGSTFTINALAPTVSGISPTSATAGALAFPLTVTGTNFTSQSTVMWGSTALATTFVSSTELTAQVTAGLVAEGGTATVTVVTPSPGGGTSGGETFTINGAALPAVSGISPSLVVAGAAAFQLTVTGTNFTNASTVKWGTTALTTTYVSPTELTAQVTATEVAGAGTLPVTVVTPAPGGGTSNAYVFEVDTAGTTAPTFATTSVTVTAGGAGTYGVTLPSTATDVSVTCLNLPSGGTCSYAGGVLTISTTGTTPTGTYSITAVFSETLPGAASALVMLPFLLLPFTGKKRRRKTGMMLAGLVVLGLGVVMASGGCGGGGSGGSYTPPPATHTVSSSGTVTLVVH